MSPNLLCNNSNKFTKCSLEASSAKPLLSASSIIGFNILYKSPVFL
nr:MAG TPA: hypothetical protein [Bacteriophage sp.]